MSLSPLLAVLIFANVSSIDKGNLTFITSNVTPVKFANLNFIPDVINGSDLNPEVTEHVVNNSSHETPLLEELTHLHKVGLFGASDDHMCASDACNSVAEEFKDLIDLGVNPCDNFYEFSCGKWSRQIPPKATADFWSVRQVAKNDLQEAFQEILERPHDPRDPRALKVAKQAYLACAEEDVVNGNGLKKIIDFIQRDLGPWPMLSRKEAYTDVLPPWSDQTNLVPVTRLGEIIAGTATMFRPTSKVFPLFQVQVVPDPLDPSTNIIQISPARLVLAKEFLRNHERYPTQIQAYRTYVKSVAHTMAKVLGMERTWIDGDADRLVDFEIELAKMEYSDEDIRMPIRKLFGRERQILDSTGQVELQLDWNFIMTRILGEYFITQNMEVLIKSFNYIQQLNVLLRDNPPEVIADYVMWKVAQHLVPWTTEKMRAEYFKFRHALTGVKKMELRTAMCTSLVSDGLPHVLLHEFLKSKPDQSAIWRNVQDSAARLVYRLSARLAVLPDPRAHDALHNVAIHVGAPWFPEDEELDEYYNEVLSSVSFSKIKLDYISYQLIFEKRDPARRFLNSKDDQSKWHLNYEDKFEVHYDPNLKILTIPATVLFKPYFEADNIVAINAARLNVMISDALLRGLYELGISFQSYDYSPIDCYLGQLSHHGGGRRAVHLPRLVTSENTTNGTSAEYVSHAVNRSVHWNQRLSQDFPGDVLAAARVSHIMGAALDVAHESFWHNVGRDTRLASLSRVNPHNLFFLSYATMLCETEYPGVPSGKHVLDALANDRHFSDTFQCPIGSPMNPDTKCPALPDVLTMNFRGGKPAMVLSSGELESSILSTCNSTLRNGCIP